MNQENTVSTVENNTEDRSLRIIKRVVKAMGVMLIIGFAALIVAIIDKANQSKSALNATESAAVSQAQSTIQPSKLCENEWRDASEVQLLVPGRIEKTIPYYGGVAFVGSSDKGGPFIAIPDRCLMTIQRIVWFENVAD